MIHGSMRNENVEHTRLGSVQMSSLSLTTDRDVYETALCGVGSTSHSSERLTPSRRAGTTPGWGRPYCPDRLL